MLEAISTILGNVESWVLALTASVWIYPVLFVLSCLDGFVPPVPSESVIITVAVAASATGTPNLALIVLVAAGGAWCGDQIAFACGRGVGVDRLRFLRGERGRRAVARAERALAQRGASLIVAARYVPVGRVAVNATAGAVGYSRRRFMVFSGIAAIAWAITSMLVGLVAGQRFGQSPLLAMGVGVVAGVVVGIVVDRALSWWAAFRLRSPATPCVAAPAEPHGRDPW